MITFMLILLGVLLTLALMVWRRDSVHLDGRSTDDYELIEGSDHGQPFDPYTFTRYRLLMSRRRTSCNS